MTLRLLVMSAFMLLAPQVALTYFQALSTLKFADSGSWKTAPSGDIVKTTTSEG